MADMALLREKLQTIVADSKQIEEICLLLENLERIEEEERYRRQMDGIKRAKEEGKRLGRPKIEEPEDFLVIAEAWERKEISAPEAARMCGMGTSTFYRRIRNFRDQSTRTDGGRKC